MTSERGQGGVGVGSQAPPRQVDPRQVDFVSVGLRSSSCLSLPQDEHLKGDVYFRPRDEADIEGRCEVFEADLKTP